MSQTVAFGERKLTERAEQSEKNRIGEKSVCACVRGSNNENTGGRSSQEEVTPQTVA